MDVFDDILTTLGTKGVLYFATDFTGAFGVAVPSFQVAARFHIVTQGHLFVRLGKGTIQRLEEGEAILIPRGASHDLIDAPEREAATLDDVLHRAGFTGGGVLVLTSPSPKHAKTRLACGHIAFRDKASHPLLQALPDRIVITKDLRQAVPAIDDVLTLMTRRIASGDLGTVAGAKRLAEILFIEALNAATLDHAPIAALVEAFRDPKIGHALNLVHASLDKAWTLDLIARDIGMSRSRFAERFTALIGTGPMTYLAEWRLQKSLALLAEGHLSIAAIAKACGYRAPAAFTRAFTSRFDQTPSAYRAQAKP